MTFRRCLHKGTEEHALACHRCLPLDVSPLDSHSRNIQTQADTWLLYRTAVANALSEAFLPLVADPNLIWNYACVSECFAENQPWVLMSVFT